MNRKEFLKSAVIMSAIPLVGKGASISLQKQNSIRLLRHATLIVQLGKYRFLIDPMLSKKGAMDPIQNAGNDTRIPMVGLPINNQALSSTLDTIDAIIITHTHRDHWDTEAQQRLDKSKPIFCQPQDVEKIRSQGFLFVTPIEEKLVWNSIVIHRTEGRHGSGELEKKMGHVSGFVLTHQRDRIYIAGDTIWCDEVKQALVTYNPDYTVLNCGAPQYVTGGGPITMNSDDVLTLHEQFPNTQLIAVHMDTINHCRESRSDLRKILSEKNLLSKILVPEDGEIIYLNY